MAAGDNVGSNESVNDAAFLTIQPSAGRSYKVRNVYLPSGTYEIYSSDGTNDTKVDAITPPANGQILTNLDWCVTNAVFVKIKNTSGGARRMQWDGVWSAGA